MARAAEFSIGLVAPLSGANAIIGDQMRQGAAAALAGTEVDLVFLDDACSEEWGRQVGEELVEIGVDIAVGFVCTETIEAAMPALADAGIETITPVVRTIALTDRRDRTGWSIFRVAPRADAEHAALGRLLIPHWRDALFALIDDGTIYGRELVEAFRLQVEEAGLEPVFTDTFRPQMENQIGLLGRLRRSGATHVLVGGDREDIAVMARDAAELDYDLTIAGGEALRAAPGEVALGEGVLMVAAPEWHELAAPATLQSLRDAGIEPDGYVLSTHAAVEIAVIALAAAEDGGNDIEAVLFERPFPTVIGPVSFDERGEMTGLQYRLYRHDGETFVPVR